MTTRGKGKPEDCGHGVPCPYRRKGRDEGTAEERSPADSCGMQKTHFTWENAPSSGPVSGLSQSETGIPKSPPRWIIASLRLT